MKHLLHKLSSMRLLMLLAVLLGMGSSAAWADVYQKVTSESDLENGKQYIIVCESDNSVLAGITDKNIGSYVSITIGDDNKITDPSGVNVLTLHGGATTGWNLYTGIEEKYLSWSSGNTLSASSSAYDWNISFDSDNVLIECNNSSGRLLRWNHSSPRFACYTSAQTSIQLYKKVEAPASPLASIALSGEYPTAFHQDDTFSHEGMKVTATYEDESTKDVTSKATFSGYDMDNIGTQEVTVSYTEGEVTKKATYNITVNAPATLTSISLSGDYQTEFTEGDEFNHDGLVVTANYDDSSTKDVTENAEFSGYNMATVGEQTVTVTYMGKTTSYNITVEEYVMPSELAIDFESDLSAYSDWEFVGIGTTNTAITAHGGSKYGATINNGGNGVSNSYITTKNKVNPETITFYVSKVSNNTTSSSWYVEVSEDGTEWNSVGDAASATNMSKGAWNEVTRDLSGYSNVYVRISYSGSTAIRTIDDITLEMAVPKTLSSITLGGVYPTAFHVGDDFSHEGMTVTANYEGGKTADVTASAIFSGYDMSETGEQTVTVSYTEGEDTKTATYDITVSAPATLESITLSGDYPTNFEQGDEFSSEGIVVTAYYDDETSKNVTAEAVFTGYEMATPGEQTVTVSYTENEVTKNETYTINVVEKKGTEENPYTVAEAIAATPASGTSADVYITGIVSAFYGDDIMGDGSNYRYYISDDGTTTDQLLVYKGKGLNNVAFNDADDLQLGDVVTILGGLTTYKGDAEVAANNYIVSLSRKPAATITVEGGTEFNIDRNNGEEELTLTATANSGATVVFTVDTENTTVNAEDYDFDEGYLLVSGDHSGVIIIKANAEAAGDYNAATEVTITVNVLGVKSEPTIVVQDENVEYGSTFTIDDSMIEGGAITVTSSNTVVATVSDLTITPAAVGTTTITINTAATETWNAGEATFTLTVTAPEGSTTAPSGEATYTFDFTDNTDWDFPTSNTTEENEYTKDGKTITLNSSSSGYKYNSGALLLGKSGATLTLPAFDKPVTKITTEGKSGASAKVTFNIFVDDEAVSTEATSSLEDHEFEIGSAYQGVGTIYTLMVTNGNNVQIPTLTVHMSQAPSETVTLNKYGYATYCSVNPMDFTTTEGYTAWRVESISDEGIIIYKKIKEPIKGGQGVLLYNKDAEGESTNVTVNFADGTTEYSESENKLIGTTAPKFLEIGEVYGLSGSNFVINNADGVINAGKAYIKATDIPAGVKSFTFVFEDETTGITETRQATREEVESIFNLGGQRMSKVQRGINIVNGKKVFVR